MKKIIISIVIFVAIVTMTSRAQEQSSSESFGNTLNLGVGVGYYGYVGQTLPVGMLNYELDVARNFTLAPFVGIYSYQRYSYWGSPAMPKEDPSYRKYYYNVTVVPVGVKGAYYFDELFHASPKWDFYAAGSAGFAFRNVIWEDGYYGDKHVYQDVNPLYLSAHVGAELHLNQAFGLFLDLSTGVSTFGLSVHFK